MKRERERDSVCMCVSVCVCERERVSAGQLVLSIITSSILWSGQMLQLAPITFFPSQDEEGMIFYSHIVITLFRARSRVS